MSLYDYRASIYLNAADFSFETIMMSALRKAKQDGLKEYMLLTLSFPEISDELDKRSAAPGGLIEGEVYDDYKENPIAERHKLGYKI